MMRLAKLFLDDSIENALTLQEERAMRPGRGSEYFWYVSAAISLADTQFRPTQSEDMKRQATDRVAKLLYKTLSLQDDPGEETLATEVNYFLDTAMKLKADEIRSYLRNIAPPPHLSIWLCTPPGSLLQLMPLRMLVYALTRLILVIHRSSC